MLLPWRSHTHTKLTLHSIHTSPEYTGEQIPTLEEALCLCDELDIQIFVEVKREHNRSVRVITECLKKYPSLYRIVAVISFFPNVLYKVRFFVVLLFCS